MVNRLSEEYLQFIDTVVKKLPPTTLKSSRPHVYVHVVRTLLEREMEVSFILFFDHFFRYTDFSHFTHRVHSLLFRQKI